jgi:hypothetical protein
VHDHRFTVRAHGLSPTFDDAQHEIHRVLLQPTTETLLADLQLINEACEGKLSQDDLMFIESKILVTHFQTDFLLLYNLSLYCSETYRCHLYGFRFTNTSGKHNLIRKTSLNRDLISLFSMLIETFL